MIFGWRPPSTRASLDAFTRALTWRSRNVWPRGLTAVVVAALAWFGMHDALVGPWLAAALAAGAIEARVSRPASAPRNRARIVCVCAARLVSGGAFAAVALVVVHRPTPIGLAAALLALCGVCLSNTMTSFGSRLATWTLAGPAAALLVLTPFVAWMNGLAAPTAEIAILAAGGGAFVIFIQRLSEAIGREGLAVRHALRAVSRERQIALEAQQAAEIARRRWALIFDQSPLARFQFDASALHDHLLRTRLEGETLGATLRRVIRRMTQVRDYIDVLEINEAALELCRGDALPRPHLPDDFIGVLAEALDRMGPAGDIPPLPTQFIRADGARIDIEAHLRLAGGAADPWSLCLATYVDMTQSMQIAREHREARDAAEQASRAKTDFLTVISHELRTPLNGVLGMAQAMAMHPLEAAQAERLAVLRESGSSLLAIVDDLLDVSRLEQGGLTLTEAPFDVAALLRALHAAYLPQARQQGLGFDVRVAPAAARTLQGDAGRVRQVLACLVSNALKFTHEGEIGIGADYEDGWLVCEVVDTGIGVDPARLATLFTPFSQADTSLSRIYGGAGLGLALCRKLCEAMGGAIAAERRPGGGSLFRIVLPLTAEPPAHPAAPPVALRVLAAEDNAVNQRVLQALLGEFGVTPRMVADGCEALAAWEAEPWDLILMDIQMPRMDGVAATREIRARETAQGRVKTPIVALTANAMPAQIESYRAAGICDVVAKPLEATALFLAICRAAEAAEAA